MRLGILAGLACALTAGCFEISWSKCERAWDDMRCDRRVGVFVNLRLDTVTDGRAQSKDAPKSPPDLPPPPVTTRVTDYNRALAHFFSRRVDEVRFEGRTTAHGALGEFRALNAGFASVPDPDSKRGHATVNWRVKRTYRFAPEDVGGKYHPSTFWPRVFGSDWSDAYVVATNRLAAADQPSRPVILIRSYYGARCHVQEIANVAHPIGTGRKQRIKRTWDVIREWDEPASESSGK